MVLTFGLGSAQIVTNLLVGGREAATATSTGNVASTSAGQLAGQLAAVAFYLGCLTILVTNISITRRFPQLSALILFLIFFSVVTVGDFVASGGQGLRFSYYTIAILLVVGWSIQPHFEDLAIFGFGGLLVAVGSLLLIPSGLGWMPTSYVTLNEKALVGTQTLAGIYPQGNILGMVLGATLPLMLLFKRRLLGIASFGVALFTLLLSSSRTSLTGLAVSTGVVIVLLVVRRPLLLRIMIVLGALFIVGVMVVLPLVTHNGSAFTNRGQIWIDSIAHWDSLSALAFGNGLAIYGIGGSIALALGAPSYHGHNEFVTVMTTSGLVAVLLLAALFGVAIYRGMTLEKTRLARIISYFLLTLLGISIAETLMRLDTVDPLAWSTWLPFVLCFFAVPDETEYTAESPRREKRATRRSAAPPPRPRSAPPALPGPTGRRSAPWR
ncbi:hypothetical protein C5D47_07845 [Rathayibacter toxicus]|uniref:O-antigen ligase family protein n=2 Tax=Rathayibacter toxicus TaxID=145458 RepID=A0A2S5Y659_9MICO|nr:hypothetical protein APU90_09115 [Rathayibacter toxicus]PPG20419.1 hypothetical protein C5D15_07810 [Rathayibacter toxicus]PPG45521.1 hypothetical protein C5D16_07780 [Rathayibacter toxicus]PPH22621.1 hypothetical protein C5D17_07815 [Rathayibacter toxicus]PPH56823.1 hypothetical protein C5D30_07805 [Rathayibacter toxicus]